MDLQRIDRELDALGSVPSDVRALIARYAGHGLSLAQADALLASLGEHSLPPMPPRLQETVVDFAVPDSEAPVVGFMPSAPASVRPAPASEPPPPSPVQSARRARMPWESDLPEATPEAMQAGRAGSVPPPPATPDFAALFGDAGDAVASRVSAPAEIASQPTAASWPPRPRHDTIRDVPAAVLASLSAEAALELAAFDKAISRPPAEPTPPLSNLPPAFDAPASAAAQDAPFTDGDRDGDGDDFEILVDDEILEIVDDDEP